VQKNDQLWSAETQNSLKNLIILMQFRF